ncbi:MAG: hypothetical protein ACOCP8_02115 [archaeon]
MSGKDKGVYCEECNSHNLEYKENRGEITFDIFKCKDCGNEGSVNTGDFYIDEK